MRCSTSVGPTRHCAASPSSRRSIPTGSGCGRCSRSRSTSAPDRPTPSTPCGGCASGWRTSSGSTRRRRSSGSSSRCSARTPRSRRHRHRPPRTTQRPVVPQQRSASGSTGTVGREPVLAQALAVVEEATTAGSLRFLLLAGEPGIGKSRLVGDLAAAASTLGAETLVGRCHEGDYAPALWPWLAIVRALARRRPRPAAGAAARRGRHDDGRGKRHRAADVRRGGPPRRAGGGDPSVAAGPRGHPLGRRVLTAAAASPGRVGPAGAGRGRLHPAYDGGRQQRGARRHDGGPGPGRGRAGPARRRRHRVRGRAAGRVRRRARRAAGRVRRGGDRRQPVLRAAVRPRARRDARPRPPRPAVAAGARRHPRRPAPADPAAAGRRGAGAHVGGRAR